MPKCKLTTLTTLATIAVAALAFLSSSPARASCGFNQIQCEDGLCYPWGSSCCGGGGACRAGYECWGRPGQSHCCRTGQQGYRDGGCAPVGISDYCANSTYCTRGRCTADGRCRADSNPIIHLTIKWMAGCDFSVRLNACSTRRRR